MLPLKVNDVRSNQREFTLFIIVQISLGALTWWVASREWRVSLTETITENLGTTIIESGTQITPFLSANGVVSVVAVLGIIATGTWGRRIIGALAAVISVCALVSVLSTDFTGITRWIAVSSILTIGLIVTNMWAAVRGSRWPMLGRKYERDRADQEPTDPWKALDQGIDPTLD